MKATKTRIVLVVIMVIIILTQSACRTNKLSNRRVNRTTALEQTNVRILAQENKQYSTVHSIVDSNGQVYRVDIFPVDSFQFSLQKGFIGRASKVELRGSIRQLMRTNDSSAFTVSEGRETHAKTIRKIAATQRGNLNSVERTRFVWGRLWGVVGVALLTIWMWRKYRKRDAGKQRG